MRDIRGTILDMIEAIERAQRLSVGLNEAKFFGDERTQWAIYSQILILGEAANRLDRTFQTSHPEIPWSNVIGMRHRLVHGYDNVDWGRVWTTLNDDLPPLLEHLKTFLQEGGSYGT